MNRRPGLEGARQVTVVPVANEQALRTRAWVEDNRRLVDKLSGGKLAYVYLPNTVATRVHAASIATISRNRIKKAWSSTSASTAAVRPPTTSSTCSQRKFDGYFNNVAGDRIPFTSPAAGIWGPKVMVINEMAGSGGDLMPYMFK